MRFRALEAAENVVWAMEERALGTLLTIAAREHETTPEALEAYRAKALANSDQATVRDGVAIISANGPMFKRANLMTALSGATSYDIMRRDLQSAVDQGLKGAILHLDTPGGEAHGAGELATYVASLRGSFPVIAYINGMGASAGYWIASAAEEIVIDPSALLGSIGVQWAMREREDPKGVTTHTFISSQSPLKNADPGSEAGAAHIQGVVDAMAQVFVQTVAANRGVSAQTVLTDFGRGGILVGQDAVNAGLADRIGTFEGVLAELSGRAVSPSRAKGNAVVTTELNPALQAIVDAAVAKANVGYVAHTQSAATTAPPVENPAVAAARATEAIELERDALIASIAGVSIEGITAKRHEREADAAAHAAEFRSQEAEVAQYQALIDEIAAA